SVEGQKTLKLVAGLKDRAEAGLIPQPVGDIDDELVRTDLFAARVAQRVEFHLVKAPVATGIAELGDIGELVAVQSASPNSLDRGSMLRQIGEHVEHRLADMRSSPENALELVCRRFVDRQPTELRVGNLDKGVRALDEIGEHLAFGQRIGDAPLQRLVEFA